nr:MAG TPA: hypothetical protein [Caudoviricetes sp.]
MYAIADTVNESNAQFSDKNLIICVLSVFSSYKNKTCYGLALISIFFSFFMFLPVLNRKTKNRLPINPQYYLRNLSILSNQTFSRLALILPELILFYTIQNFGKK